LVVQSGLGGDGSDRVRRRKEPRPGEDRVWRRERDSNPLPVVVDAR
jgi:hypothetical protein